MTGWPQFFDNSSPSVRARISTAPPAGYGTNRCTAFAGNPVWAGAAPIVAITPAAMASIRTDPPMASLPIFSRWWFFIAHRHTAGILAAGRSQGQSQHVDNPLDHVKFRCRPRYETRQAGSEDELRVAEGDRAIRSG